MKKYLGVLLTVVLVSSLFAGCAKSEEAPVEETTTVETEETTEEVATEEVVTEEVVTEEVVDVITTASIVTDGEALVAALGTEGNWIAATLNDITLTDELVVEGEFTNKDVATRKIALYTQDADFNITASFNLTAPKMTVKSENTKLQGGTFIGDVYVEANGFQLKKANVTGNIYYVSQDVMDTAIIGEGSAVSGVQEVQ